MFKKYLFLISITFFLNISIYSTGAEISVFDTAYKTGSDDQSFLIGKNSNYKKGIDSLKQAVKFEKKGKTKKANRRYNDSIKLFIEANDENPNEPNILYYLGFIYEKVNDYTMAEIYYTEGLEIDPKHNIINAYLGDLYIETNRIDKAKERLKVLKNCNCNQFKKLEAKIKLSN